MFSCVDHVYRVLIQIDEQVGGQVEVGHSDSNKVAQSQNDEDLQQV